MLCSLFYVCGMLLEFFINICMNIHNSLVLIFDPKCVGGGGGGVKKTFFFYRKTILSHFMFSSRFFMIFPTFFENNYFAGGGMENSFHDCKVNKDTDTSPRVERGSRLVLASNLLAGDLTQPSYTSTYIYLHTECIQ